MATWAKVKFFWDKMLGSAGSTLAATSTASGDYSADYLYNMLETNIWKAADTLPAYISYDAGAGNTRPADYLAIAGHNLFSSGALLSLQYSSDGMTYLNAFTPFVPSSDGVVLKEFTNPGLFRYWRLGMTGMAAAPFMAICVWGVSTELDYATASFDPYAQEAVANVNLSQGGYVAGIHTQYIERSMSFKFDDADAALYEKVRQWWDTSGVRNFFVAWEVANNPGDVFLMRPDPQFNNPIKNGGVRRDISIALKGRKE